MDATFLRFDDYGRGPVAVFSNPFYEIPDRPEIKLDIRSMAERIANGKKNALVPGAPAYDPTEEEAILAKMRIMSSKAIADDFAKKGA